MIGYTTFPSSFRRPGRGVESRCGPRWINSRERRWYEKARRSGGTLLNMSFSRRDLTDAQWELLDSLIPEPPRRKDGAPQQPQKQNSRRVPFAPIPQALENREAVCLASELSATCCTLRAPCREFSGYASPRMLRYLVAAFMR